MDGCVDFIISPKLPVLLFEGFFISLTKAHQFAQKSVGGVGVVLPIQPICFLIKGMKAVILHCLLEVGENIFVLCFQTCYSLIVVR